MAVRREIDRAEFDSLTKRLTERAQAGRGVPAIPPENVEDVAQDVWVKIVRQPRLVTGGSELEAHAHTALKDAAIDFWRSHTRKKDVPREKLVPLEAMSEEADNAGDPLNATFAAIEARRIRETLVSVVGPQAAAYAILDALELTEVEIAVQLGISTQEAASLRKQVSRSRAPIATALNPPGRGKEAE
jgi:DNA-directed RNA polymerase specialized sigma24 family protein